MASEKSSKLMLLSVVLAALAVSCLSFIYLTGLFSLAVAEKGEFPTFREAENLECTENSKPVVRMFSASWCVHCAWIKETFSAVAKEYAEKNQVIAHSWVLDLGDDLLTEEAEKGIPQTELEVFNRFSPKGSVPAFVFGCKYYRIGNGYEKTMSPEELQKEAEEFKAVIEKLIEESKKQ